MKYVISHHLNRTIIEILRICIWIVGKPSVVGGRVTLDSAEPITSLIILISHDEIFRQGWIKVLAEPDVGLPWDLVQCPQMVYELIQ